MSIPDDRDNPFAPPKAAVLEAATADAEFVAEGRKVPAGRGVSWIGEAWQLFLRAPGMWILLFVVFVVVTLIISVVPVLGNIVTSICYPVVAAGLMLGCRELEQGGRLTINHLWMGFTKNAGSLMLVGVLYLVGAMIVGFIVGIGMALSMPFIVGSGPVPTGTDMIWKLGPIFVLAFLVAMALMMPLIMAMWFAPAIVVFHDEQPMAAMKMSFKGCLRNFVPFLVYGIVSFGILLAALIPFGLGLLVVVPVIWATMYTGYRDIYLQH